MFQEDLYENSICVIIGDDPASVNAGGKGYSYTFCIPYDEKFEDFELGAAHAIDCFFLFGNFDGIVCRGTNEEVDASIRFQKMIANIYWRLCRIHTPSVTFGDSRLAPLGQIRNSRAWHCRALRSFAHYVSSRFYLR